MAHTKVSTYVKISNFKPEPFRDVSTGATGTTAVAPKFSDILTLFQPRGADSAHHRRGRSKHLPVITSLLTFVEDIKIPKGDFKIN